MPRRNNRDRNYEPKEINLKDSYDQPSEKLKPVRRRKGKNDKNIYRQDDNG